MYRLVCNLKQFLLRRFQYQHVHTEYDDYVATIHVEDNLVGLKIIDTADPPSEDYFKVHAAVAMFSRASRTSFENLATFSPWFCEFYRKGGLVSLVGTHADVDRPEVSSEEASALAEKIRARYFSVCTKEADQVRDAWLALLRQITWSTSLILTVQVKIPEQTHTVFSMLTTETWHHFLNPIWTCFGRKHERLARY